MWKEHLCIVMAIEHYNPLGQIRSLGEAGVNPVYIAIKGRAKIASSSKYISKCHFVDTVEEGYQLLIEEYGNVYVETGLKPFVFSSDDKGVGFLDLHYDELKDKFIFFNAGKQGRINEYMDKKNILELAKKYGLNVLEAKACKKGEVPQGIEYPIITKSISPNVGGWKSDVHICHSEKELLEAYKEIDAPVVLVQKYIEKKNEYCMEGFAANRGKDVLIAIVSTYDYLLPDYYSPYMTVRSMDDEYIRKALQGMFAEIEFEGVFEVEFLIDQDGTYYFGEVNFRNSTWSYASTVAGMPLPVLWAETQEQGYMNENLLVPISESFKAMVEPVDYAKRVKEGKIDIAEWLSAFKQAKCCYYYSVEDMDPWRVCVDNWDNLG
ncbi:biotin carboxylase [Mordavella massiliensis]|uniref:Biotin carboxylase n=1 Tax=Mordavella massiliensis TaxID=1871024 RepID=A0A938XE84_9CLOT|nr:biotin carboxylase [Mordavella massiliensis]MBM6949108.1 biotin carboxylase [Mordavella massiliensis]